MSDEERQSVSAPEADTQNKEETPEDTHEILTTLFRYGHEVRVTWECYRGSYFLSFQVWSPGPYGKYIPVRGKQVTVRRRELAEVADALKFALEADAKLRAEQEG